MIVRVPTGKTALATRALELWLRRVARADLHAVLEAKKGAGDEAEVRTRLHHEPANPMGRVFFAAQPVV